jgi:hypothetical protein
VGLLHFNIVVDRASHRFCYRCVLERQRSNGSPARTLRRALTCTNTGSCRGRARQAETRHRAAEKLLRHRTPGVEGDEERVDVHLDCDVEEADAHKGVWEDEPGDEVDEREHRGDEAGAEGVEDETVENGGHPTQVRKSAALSVQTTRHRDSRSPARATGV